VEKVEKVEMQVMKKHQEKMVAMEQVV